MTENSQTMAPETNTAAPVIHVSPSPHLSNQALTTQRLMLDVVIGLMPVVLMALYVFRFYAVKQLAICVISCLAAEALFTKMRSRSLPLKDCSALVTGIILALSLPGPAPWYVGFIASFVAIGTGKTIFGGVGMNLFNPAMVGRAFVMIAFASVLAASGYQDVGSTVDAITQATPMDTFKQTGAAAPLSAMFFGLTNGSLGETSALACLIGGLFLCIRRTASWEIPAGVILSVLIFGGIANLVNPDAAWTVLHHLLGGSLLFGASFLAPDQVSSLPTPKGKFIFGLGVGALIQRLSGGRHVCRAPDECPDTIDQSLDHPAALGCPIIAVIE